LVASLSLAIRKALANQIPIIHVVAGFIKGSPEVSPHNKMFTGVNANNALKFNTDAAAKIYSVIATIE